MMMRRLPLWRLTVQVGMLGLFLLPLAGVPFVAGTLAASRIFGVALADPLLSLEAMLAAGQVWWPLVGAAALVTAFYLVVGRAFCAWVCPLGLVLEWAGRVWPRARVGRGRGWALWVLAGVLVLSVALGLPVYGLLSPVNVVLRFLLFGFGLEALLLVAVVAVDLWLGGRAWCRSLCPLGAWYGLLGRVALVGVRLEPSACSGCGACESRCSMGAVTASASVDPFLCTQCGDCIGDCPTGALGFAVGLPAPVAGSAVDGGRRAALVAFGATALGGLGRWAVAGTGALGRLVERRHLRPPGALPEGAFLAQCLRCGQCAQACPREAIHLGQATDGLAVGTPVIVARSRACDLCMKCVDVCPSGALAPTEAPRMGVAELDRERCLAWQGTVCRACFNNCPRLGQALTLQQMQQVIVHEDACTGCGLCEEVCVLEEPAIRVRPV